MLGWIWFHATILVRSGRILRLRDMTAGRDKRVGLRNIAKLAQRLLEAQNECVRRQVHDPNGGSAVGFEPSWLNYEHFRLESAGLRIGFDNGQVAYAICENPSVVIPYPIVRPYLSKLGVSVFAAIRRSRG
jgi:hypothetical protein